MLQVIHLQYVRLAQLDRAFGYGPKGREFESSSARYKASNEMFEAFFYFGDESTQMDGKRMCLFLIYMYCRKNEKR